FWDRERQSMNGGGAEREGDTESETGSSDEEEDEDDESVDEEVNVEFEAYSISDNDYDRIKKLTAPVNIAELTDFLIQQNHIGSVIKQTDVSEDSDDDGTQCAEQIKELILSSCEKSCGKISVEKLDTLFNDASKPVGFLLSERFINVPPQIALPMHQQLQKELAEAHGTNKLCGECSFYLLISKMFVEAGKNNPKKKWSSQEKDELMFASAEEEFFYEKAILKSNYSVQEESDTCLGGRWSFDDVPMKPLQTVMLIPGDKMDEIMGKLKEHLSL
uniref:BRCA2 and CDKN1A-interacting protein n=1 Tax=Panthera tigris altaica TaxID=74533 RepID=A0A8C9K748_PANTA